MGCQGCSQPGAAADIPPNAPGNVVATPGEPEPSGPGQAPALAPVLTDAALEARTRAQRKLLGRSAALFEDASGKPIPWISRTPAGPNDNPPPNNDALSRLPGSSGLGVNPEHDVRHNGNALGLFVPLEPPPDGEPPLLHFHEALRNLAIGQDPDGKVRVAIYGASHTDADIYPQYMRTYLQERFGNGGHGFIHLVRPWKWYRHVDMGVDSSNRWLTEHVQRRKGRDDGLFGLMGASMSAGQKHEWSRVYHRDGASPASIYDLYFLAQPRGGKFTLYVDGNKHETISTRSEAVGPGYHTVQLPEGPHELEIKVAGNGEVRLFGMTVERATPGVVVDTLAVGGTRMANQLQWNDAIWSDNFRRRSPDLYMFLYGTNEATDENQPISIYEANLRGVLERFQRDAPEASCLLVGPGDFPYQTDGGWAPRPRLRQIVEVQRQVAGEMGCGFWDLLAFMGGEGSMNVWVNARPQMARSDRIHFTKRGYVRIGMALTDAMMMDYDG